MLLACCVYSTEQYQIYCLYYLGMLYTFSVPSIGRAIGENKVVTHPA